MELNTGDRQLNYLLFCVAVGIRVQGVEIWVGPIVTASLYWQWSQNSKNMRESLYTSVMTIAGSGSCSYGTANVAHLLIVKLMGHSIYYFEALLPQCLVHQLPIYNRTN